MAEELWLDYGPMLREQEDLAGGMQWKIGKGREYLIRHRNDPIPKKKISKSLGVRSPETEILYNEYIERRERLQRNLEQSKHDCDDLIKQVKHLSAHKLPFLVTRVCRQLYVQGIGDGEVLLANEASRYAYEAHFGVTFDGFPSLDLILNDGIMPTESWADLLATGMDFDIEQDGLVDAVLRSIRGIERNDATTFVATPASGPVIVTAYTASRLLEVIDQRCRPGWAVLDAIDWALHEPIVRAVGIGDDGMPVPVWAPDPRALIFTSCAMADVGSRNEFRLREVAQDLATLWARDNDEPFLSEHLDIFPALAELHGKGAGLRI